MDYGCLYNKQINAHALIGQSADGYCAGKRASSEFVNPLPAAHGLRNSSRVQPISCMVYQLISHRNLWFTA